MRAAPTLVRMPPVAGAGGPSVAGGVTRARVAPGVPAHFCESGADELASHRRPR